MTRRLHEEIMKQYTEDVADTDKFSVITVNGVAVPEPLREAPPYGTTVWATSLAVEGEASELTYRIWPVYQLLLERGLLHLTEEAAIKHARALISASGGTFNRNNICRNSPEKRNVG